MTALALLATSAVCGARGADASPVSEPRDSAAVSVADGTVKQLPGGAVLRLTPGTKMEMGRSLKLQLGRPGSPQTVTQVVKLLSGRIDVEIPLSKFPKTAILLQAPHKVSGVAKGGHSIAIADGNGVTIAAVDGDMLVASGNDWKGLSKGVVRTFIGHDQPPRDHAVPGVPSLRLANPLLLSLGCEAPTARADASGVKDAEHYQLSVWRVGSTGKELARRIDTKGGAGEILDLLPGQYQISARAVDSAGIFGPESAGSALRVVGTELPEGARCEGKSILLGQHGRVKLLGAAGLEASYGASQHFVPAPSSVGLSRGESTRLRLREPGSQSEVEFGLEPRSLRADVDISPKHAHWPSDTLEVTVHLFDARGRAVAQGVVAKATVLVNVQPVSVAWQRAGNAMHAFIPKPTQRGPWVVRVEVADQFGDAAGRDFMEVAGPDTERVSAN